MVTQILQFDEMTRKIHKIVTMCKKKAIFYLY